MEHPKILYLCDKKQCDKCSPICKHTSDIKYAKNFFYNGFSYVEEETVVPPKTTNNKGFIEIHIRKKPQLINVAQIIKVEIVGGKTCITLHGYKEFLYPQETYEEVRNLIQEATYER